MKQTITNVTGEYVRLDGEQYYRIANSHLMDDFFMSLVGAGDHWMFISSNGALSAGRRNADNALFPYSADDQITAARADTGSTTLIRCGDHLWEPFAAHSAGTDKFHRNLYKTPLGNKLVFEEVNESLGLTFRYRWTSSQRFGFVRSCRLENTGDKKLSLELLDGLQNILPYGIGSEFLMRFSNLANAYKKSELVAESDVGLFYLSSVPTDRAEPSEGLKATTVWQTGLKPDAIVLCADQIEAFRMGGKLQSESDVRGKRGAFLLNQSLELAPEESIEWQVVAELAQDHAAVIGLDNWLQQRTDPAVEIRDDIAASEQEFLRILSSSDALQKGANQRVCNRHLSNTVFNLMRGGVPLEGYHLHSEDFRQFVTNFNRPLEQRHDGFFSELPNELSLGELRATIAKLDDPDLTRLGLEYLPLAFSRRHGDPTRPWNHFSIDLQSENGRTNLNYQGNWRDLFQNWEALLVSFPEFSTGMICRFVNATTADGYNPYKVTRNGFDWESPNPDDPWSNIGYWGDHQIIYLLKLLEWTRKFYPQGLDQLLDSQVFAHANVPYRIKPIEEIKKTSRNTIDFDSELAAAIDQRVVKLGADGKLLPDSDGGIHRVTLVEKILTLSLAKLSNFIPDGGIWLNTQRPEWNDANNALVGNGLSMVTACYLHRWCKFMEDWIATVPSESFKVSKPVNDFFAQIAEILSDPPQSLDEKQRETIVDALSHAGSNYRQTLYSAGLSGGFEKVSRVDCVALFRNARQHLESTIRNNRRADGLYHAYNLLDWHDGGVAIEALYEMLEGQVAALSSGLLNADEAVEVLDALRGSKLYRENQDSYVLYPDRQLPKFLEKNLIDPAVVESSGLLKKLLAEENQTIISADIRGGFHFNGQFKNSADLREAIACLGSEYADDVANDGAQLIESFDTIFGHRQFTGRSGTFFGYEGLGSIYWHMVSKLALAVSENYSAALESGASAETTESLKNHLTNIKRGIGAEKSPSDYGAFPSDPYSHTPENAGVKQPGMTGQVKEDILARFAEIGIEIEDGCVSFQLGLFDRKELLEQADELEFFDLAGKTATVPIPQGAFGFTLFQVPFVYQAGDDDLIEVRLSSGETRQIKGSRIDSDTSQQLFSRTGNIEKISCSFQALLG